jgi:molybdopterin-guanine dinucleotide biosynthesis adapter protein
MPAHSTLSAHSMSLPHPPVLGFAAFSGTGKTTLLTQLIPLLKRSGLRVGVIKHSHHDIELDQPGKDSHRLRMSGAASVMLVSAHRRTVFTELDAGQQTLADHIDSLPTKALDLVLVEGFRDEAFPKIELHRPSLGKPLLYPNDEHIVAIASDQALMPHTTLPCLDLNDVEAIARFILERFLSDTHD